MKAPERQASSHARPIRTEPDRQRRNLTPQKKPCYFLSKKKEKEKEALLLRLSLSLKIKKPRYFDARGNKKQQASYHLYIVNFSV